jgi:hypothetical protein
VDGGNYSPVFFVSSGYTFFFSQIDNSYFLYQPASRDIITIENTYATGPGLRTLLLSPVEPEREEGMGVGGFDNLGLKGLGEGRIFPLSQTNKNERGKLMPTLPDRSMVDIASGIIDLLGDNMIFQRYIGGAWEDSESAVIYLQPRDSLYRRSVRGIEDSIDFTGFAAAAADIRKGDRTVIDAIFFVIDALENRGTHLELGLRQTDEARDQ